MFAKVLVANRGEIAARVIRTLRRMGIASVAVYAEPDRFTMPVLNADESVAIGGAAPADSYLRIGPIVDACRRTGAEAVHPGYGFLSERAAFAEALAEAGIAFIGPTPAQLRAFGLKHSARALAEANGVPLLPGTGLLDDAEAALREVGRIGYPVMLKSTAGGGGIGMRLCRTRAELTDAFAGVARQGDASFGDARLYLERFVEPARHVEVQVFGDGRGGVRVLGERDCSLQRRNQKVFEETPAPALAEATRAALHDAAYRLAAAVSYASAGTVEFILDARTQEFFFLEVNARLQVEHCVTEAVTGIDLVEWMVRQAAGGFVLPDAPRPVGAPVGAAVEARLYAETAASGRPSTGRLTEVWFPDTVRVDGWIETGAEVTAHYDPLLAKLIATGADRDAAWAALSAALGATRIGGIETNLSDLIAVADDPRVRAGDVTTGFLGAFAYDPRTIDVLSPGMQSSIQELPGRLGLWSVGIPPSGPMDERSHRLANRIVGNDPQAAALEVTQAGPTLRFHGEALIALTGAVMPATLDAAAVPMLRAVPVQAGQVLSLGTASGPGQRSYLAVRHGFDVPRVLGSRATFMLGGFGGHATGALRTGDLLRVARSGAVGEPMASVPEPPPLTHDWTLEVLYGPHGAPDFFAPADIDDLFSASYEVHYNSARTGVRLIGPTPRWARPDGGEAGLHPSNLHDNAYAVGAIDFTGDMPILLGPDGPSLGGFVCPAVVTDADQWKLGQLRPGDRVRFARAASFNAKRMEDDPVLMRLDLGEPVTVRRQGSRNILVEFGAPALEIGLRLRAHLLMQALAADGTPGIIDVTPGIRSLQIHHDPAVLPTARLLDRLAGLLRNAPAPETVAVDSRVVHLPLSWDDDQARLAATRYRDVVRPDAPWCPSNIEFIRRINGLASEQAVADIVFGAEYLVLGLGDVYLGAPVATPIDPRHRLVTTKYNPARTWTPENAVGIGGAYLCVYGMEGPGGYQLVGRTVQMWNTWRRTPAFTRPHLLRFFDRIRFFPVSAAELIDARAAFPHGRYDVRIEAGTFDLAGQRALERREATGIAAARARQQAAFAAERRDWAARGLDSFVEPVGAAPVAADALPPGCVALASPVPGSLWKLLLAVGDPVRAGDTVAIVESMKMEMRLVAPCSGRLTAIVVLPGRELRAGQRVAVIRKQASAPN